MASKALDLKELEDYTPLPIDWALHGRPVHETPYATLWRQTLGVISSFACGTMYLGLRDSDVRFSLYKGPTACINLITKDIYINPIFLRKWAVTPTDLAFVLMHEAFHPLIDPDKRDGVSDKYNICSDALINSIIFRISPALVSLPKKFYSENNFPGCLLRSGTSKVWRKAVNEHPNKVIITGLPVEPQKIHIDTYGTLYPNARRAASISRPSIQKLMSIFFGDDEDSSEGNGGGGQSLSGFDPKNQAQPGDGENLTDEEFEAIKAIAESFASSGKSKGDKVKSVFDKADDTYDKTEGPAESEGGKSAGKSGTLREYWTEAAKKEDLFQDHKQLTRDDRIKWAYETIKGINPGYARNAFGGASDPVGSRVKEIEELYINDGIIESFIISSQNDVRGELVDLLSFKKVSKMSVIPGRPTRYGYGYLANGFSPIFYQKDKSVKEQQRKNSVVYVDFSGSMGGQIKWLMALLPQLENRCNADIWVFSTEIVKSSVEEFRQGKYSTTGGTSFDAVVQHALEENEDAHNFLMITDGCDHLSAQKQQALRASGKNCYMLVVEDRLPNKGMVQSHQQWCTRVFLKERKWWSDLGLNPKGKGV